MSESFYTIIDRGTLEVEHQGETITVELPAYLKELAGRLDELAFIRKWMADDNKLQAVFHCFLQKDIIDCRAVARPAIRTMKDKESFEAAVKALENPNEWITDAKRLTITKSIEADKRNAQKRLNGKQLKPTPRPGETAKNALSKASPEDLIKAALSGGKSPEELMALLQKMQGNK